MKPVILLLCAAILTFINAADAATVFITGADRGLGLEFAKEYAARGDTVIATCRHPDSATDLRTLARHEKNLVVEKLDVGNDNDINALAAKYTGKPIDILINNAGVLGKREDQTLGTFNRIAFQDVMDTNVFGALAVSEALRANVIASEQKKIIAITSGAGSIANVSRFPSVPYYYSISKAGLNMAMAALGAGLKSQGAIVALVSPGSVDTDMLASFVASYGFKIQSLTKEESVSKMIGVIDHIDQAKASQGVINYDGRIVAW